MLFLVSVDRFSAIFAAEWFLGAKNATANIAMDAIIITGTFIAFLELILLSINQTTLLSFLLAQRKI